MSTNEIGIEEGRKRFGDLVIAAEQRGEITIVTRYGKPAAAIVPITKETAMLTYAPANYGNRTVTGPWSAWQAQLPGLPDDPNTKPTDDLANDRINTANERFQGATITVTDGDGVEHTETLSLFWYPRLVNGELVCRAYIATAPEETRQGRCQVCGEFGELVKRLDASNIAGWVCRDHDGLDIVFA